MNGATSPESVDHGVMATRRNLLQAAVVTAAFIPAGTANAADRSSIEARLKAYFRDKSNRDVDATMAHFSRSGMAYGDAAVGALSVTWEEQRSRFAEFMPNWPATSVSQPLRIVGYGDSAIVFFYNSPGMFGPVEIRAAAAVNYRNSKIVRWVDYWDGRHFGIENFEAIRRPEFPPDFRESLGGKASPLAERVARGLADALRTRNIAAAVGFFDLHGVIEDLPSHIQVVGHRSIEAFLTTASLPYMGAGARVRHVVNGGYEWSADGPVKLGITALETNRDGKITRMTSVWDGSRISRDALITLAGATVEE